MNSSPTRPPSTSHWVRRALVLTLAGLLVVTAALWWARPVDVEVVGLEEREIVSTLAVVGRVRAPSRARLGASVAGTAEAVLVREGDEVESDALLIRLNDREARAAVREAEAALAETRASVTRAIAEADRELTQARRDLERIRAVRRVGGLTRQREEEAEIRAADAQSRLDALRAETGGSAGEPAAVAAALASLERARSRLELTRVRAPGPGTVLARFVEPGDAVSPGQILMDMAYAGSTELVSFPAEENLGRLALDAPASVSADAFPDRTFEAAVSLIAPSVDPTQGTVEVRLTAPDPPEYLRPDMTVSINIETARRPRASVLPAEAVRELGGEEPWVATIRNGRIERQPVEIGLVTPTHVEILSGVGPNEAVVRRAAEVEPGDRVRASSASP